MISVPQFRQNFGYMYQGQPVLQASWQSGFNTISSVGQFFGGFLCSLVADRWGRRAALLVGIMFVAGGIFGEVFLGGTFGIFEGLRNVPLLEEFGVDEPEDEGERGGEVVESNERGESGRSEEDDGDKGIFTGFERGDVGSELFSLYSM